MLMVLKYFLPKKGASREKAPHNFYLMEIKVVITKA
jgi:hypothetical protein